ncbi:MAG: (d)CMP kinase [Candidatus Margulisiibacteriota bacterium]
MTKFPLIIAIDGPAASGKSTVARLLAEKLGILYVNSGFMYRAITYKCIEQNLFWPKDLEKIIALTKQTSFEIRSMKMWIDGLDLSSVLTLPSVDNLVSIYSKIKGVREILVNKQRQIASTQAIVMDGRDIGTIVFPSATYKFYLDASVSVRASRRYYELLKLYPSQSFNLQVIEKEITNRDKLDSERVCSPLVKATDAIYIDTSNLNIDSVVTHLYEIVSLPPS